MKNVALNPPTKLDAVLWEGRGLGADVLRQNGSCLRGYVANMGRTLMDWCFDMAKKSERWQNEDMAVNNPFAALSGLKSAAPVVTDMSKGDEKALLSKTAKLPKVKSSRLERAHRGGKTVTVVAFHGTPDDDAKTAWLKAAKTKLGVGGAIEDGTVILQGDQRERLGGIS